MNIKELDCPICTDTIDGKYLCKTTCGHIYCIRCIILSLKGNLNVQYVDRNITMNNVLINRIGIPGKIEAVISRLRSMPEGKAIIYIKNQISYQNYI